MCWEGTPLNTIALSDHVSSIGDLFEGEIGLLLVFVGTEQYAFL